MSYSKGDISILISTMNRSDFSFLDAMFPHHEWRDLNLVIVNQTKKGQKLKSELENILVVNSYEVGLSKSRNLALKNCRTTYGVIADDDVVYKSNFLQKIVNAFNKYPNAGLILFQVETFSGKPFMKNYPSQEIKVSERNRPPLSSVEMTFNRDYLLENKISFNEYFGLGSYFQSGEEQLLFKEFLNKNISVYHIPEFIVEHDEVSSASDQGSNRFIYAQGALKYLEYGNLSFIWLAKFIFFLVRHQFISASESLTKYKVGVNGIKKIKNLIRKDSASQF
ncbi:MAG: glycosyltransferase [Psychroflexus halocasei]